MQRLIRSALSTVPLTVALISLAVAALLAGCGGGDNIVAPGTVNVQLTDSPACGFDHVYVTVDHVEISADGNNWTTVPVPSNLARIDLLNLSNGVLLSLGDATLPAGAYQQVRLVLAANGNAAPWANSVVLTGSNVEISLKTPSGPQSGFKIKGPFAVQSGTSADLLLDFNACKSIVVAGASGQYLLRPVVTAMAQVVSGSVSGVSVPGARIYAEQQTSTGPVVVSGAVADPVTGAFTLSPILESSLGGAVDVVIVPAAANNHATYIVMDVPISAGGATSIGTVTAAAGSTTYSVSGTVSVSGSPGAANLVAYQTVTSSMRTYELASTATTTGPYDLALPASGPWLGTYSTALPIALAEDASNTDAGAYVIAATDTAGTTVAKPADVAMGPVVSLDFALAP